MSPKKNSSKDGQSDPPDAALWEFATKGTRRLQDDDKAAKRPQTVLLSPSRSAENAPVPLSRVGSSTGLDRATAQKFRQGKMTIDGCLDLHGLDLLAAQAAVFDFLLRQAGAGCRCLLIITGKGAAPDPERPWYEPERGTIKRNIMLWLEHESLKGLILSTASAQPQHGGAGALYILLRRQR